MPDDQPGSAELRERVVRARHRQTERQGVVNSQLQAPCIEQFCSLDSESTGLLDNAMDRLGLSARAYHRILKLARTIADLEEAAQIDAAHLSQAIQFRSLDRRP